MESEKNNIEAGQLQESAPGQTLRLRFNEILLETLQQNFTVKKEALPADFVHKKIEEDGALMEQRSSLYSFRKFENIKFGAFNAVEAVYVRNSVIWPADDYDFPAFIYDSSETTRWLFLLIDLHPMRRDNAYLDRYAKPLAKIKSKYKDIPMLGGSRTSPREWTKEYSSGYPFFLRCAKEYEGEMEQAFKDYVNFYVERVKEATPIEDVGHRAEVLELKNRFKNVYAENDPGGGLYRKFFGDEWAERFLSEFLFA